MKTFPLNLRPVILVDVKLSGPKGSRFVKMILDTGASFTMASPQILSEIGCDPVLSSNVKKICTASSVEFVPFVKLPVVEALGYKVGYLDIVAHLMPTSIPAEGLLGLNFLSRFNLDLQFLNKRMIIADEMSA